MGRSTTCANASSVLVANDAGYYVAVHVQDTDGDANGETGFAAGAAIPEAPPPYTLSGPVRLASLHSGGVSEAGGMLHIL
jgi:hypothetical protein